MSGHTSVKVSAILVLTAILLCPFAHSSNVRDPRSIVDYATVGSLQGGLASPVQVLDDWCANLTRHLNTTLEKFENITFNRSMASSNISSGVTLVERIIFDLSHIQVYSLLFAQIPSHMTGQQFTLCLKDGVRAMGRLTVGMEIAESYLNGTSSSPPQLRNGARLSNQTRYQDLSREMAVLKGQMRDLVIIIGNNIFGGSLHASSV